MILSAPKCSLAFRIHTPCISDNDLLCHSHSSFSSVPALIDEVPKSVRSSRFLHILESHVVALCAGDPGVSFRICTKQSSQSRPRNTIDRLKTKQLFKLSASRHVNNTACKEYKVGAFSLLSAWIHALGGQSSDSTLDFDHARVFFTAQHSFDPYTWESQLQGRREAKSHGTANISPCCWL